MFLLWGLGERELSSVREAGEATMKPYYSEDGIEIFHGDCREAIRNLPAVDCVVSDPPFGVRVEDWVITYLDKYSWATPEMSNC